MSNFTRLSRFGAVITTFVAVMLAAPIAQAQGMGLGLSPMRVELRIPAGQQRSGTVTLTEDTAATLRIRTEIDDFLVDANSTPQFERELASEVSTSCKNWLSVNPMEIDVQAAQQIPVRYTIQVPPNTAEGSYHCAAGFVTAAQHGEMESTGIRTSIRVMAAFYVIVGNPTVNGGLKQMLVEPVAGKDGATDWRAVLILHNGGSMHFRSGGSIELSDETGKVVQTMEIPSLPILPSRDQRVVIPMKADFAKTSYKLKARLDMGNGEIQEGRITVNPPKEK